MPLIPGKSRKAFEQNVEEEMKSGKPQDQSLAIAYAVKRKGKKKKMAEGGVASPTKTNTKTGGSNPGGASTGGVGSGLGGAGTGGAATGGASTGGAGTVNVTLSGNSGTGSNSGGGKSKGKGKESPVNINISNVGGKTGAGKVASGDGPGSSGTGGSGKDASSSQGGGDPSDENDLDNDPEKYAEGGEVNVRQQKRPMPNNRYNDSKMVGKNSGNKAPGEDSWTDNPTIRQAQKPSITKLSRPKMVGSDGFSVRDRDDVDKDLHRMDSEPPASDLQQPRKRYDEERADGSGNKVPDMASQHNNKKAPYNKAIEDQYAQDMAAAEMKKVQSYAKGGEVDHATEVIPDKGFGKIIRVGLAKGGPVMEPKDHDMELMERDDEAHMQERLAPGEHGEQPKKQRDELDASKQNSNPLDMERQHNNGRKPYAEGGMAEMDDQPYAEADEERHNSIAAAIMAKKERIQSQMDSGSKDLDHMVRMYKGGQVEGSDESQVDIMSNGAEHPNAYYKRNEDEVLKENYDEDMRHMSQPKDSNEKGDSREDERSDPRDMVDSIRRKMMSKRQFKSK